MIRKQWTHEDEATLINMRKEGATYDEIATTLGRTANSVLMKGSRLMTPDMRQRENRPWTDNEHFKLLSMCAEGFRVPDIAKALDRTDAAIRLKAATFIKSGQLENINKTLDRSKSTKLYLIYFPGEDFYKVGITQQSIAARFSGYPTYKVLDCIEFEDLDSAYDTESEILNDVTNYVPECFGKHNSGKTECFRAENTVREQWCQELKLEMLI